MSVVVIPVYNHGPSAVRVMAAVRALGLDGIVVDDGSESRCAALLADAATVHSVQLVRLATNQGKGGAVMAGLRAARARGYSHALQIDADGQHDTADIPDFLRRAREHPDAVICGTPVYDETVPLGRYVARYLTHVWVWIHTLSFHIRDSMCGFRVYPLAAVMPVIDGERVGLRMDFDIEVLVRLHWRGIVIEDRPTAVVYPVGGVSHFRPWSDNLRISSMHVRLFFGMLRRLPLLLWRKIA